MKKLLLFLNWDNFSRYYSEQIGEAVSEEYESTISDDLTIDLSPFDVIMEFFPKGRLKPLKHNFVRLFWEPHEFDEADSFSINVACCKKALPGVLDWDKNAINIPMGVNTKHFFPQPFPNKEKMQVGWAGAPDNNRKQYPETKACVESVTGVEFVPSLTHYVSGKMFGPIEKLSDMGEYYKTIDLYVCGSAAEGFHLPFLEASACGRPIVTFNVGIAKELEEQGAGITVIDHFAEMRDRIANLRDERSKLLEMGNKSWEVIQKYWSWDVVKPLWLDVFRKAEEHARNF
jgi:hypothetical protein